MSVRFGLVGGPTTVNIFSVTALNCIMTHSFVSLDMFDVLLFHKNDNQLGYHLSYMIPFLPMSIYKRHDLS